MLKDSPEIGANGTVDEYEFRSAMSRFASGLTVVAALDEAGRPAGLTCQSFSSLSLDPPLVLICIRKGSASWARIESTGRFGVSILANDQADVCKALGRPNAKKFESVGWQAVDSGAVYIDGALAMLDCRVDTIHAGGDHIVVFGEVCDFTVREDGAPLLFFRGAFGTGGF